jgi:site-specific recombinase XerD
MASMPIQESEMTTATSEDGALQRLLDDEIEPFLQHLRAARYADETLQRKRTIAREFARWAQQQLIVADNLNSDSAAEFVVRLPQRAKTRVELERATVRLFLEHLYSEGASGAHCRRPESDPGSYPSSEA